MADLTCGEGGSSGQQIIDRINENTAAIVINVDAIAALDVRLSALELPDPRASVRLSAVVPAFTISDDVIPVLMPCFDTVVTEQGGYDAYIDPVDSGGSLTNSTGGTMEALLAVGMNVDFSGNETLEVYVYVNGAQYSALPMVIQGEGAGHPVGMYWESEIILDAGDTVDIRGRNGDTGSYDIAFLRCTFRIDSSVKDVITP